ncbi:MAG: (2Fe-2S)-binding protein [Burkholderiales bacterium]|nr:MAG: (2Fe-2S)-binding protein [Burkholderiales bacterium]
MGRPTKPSRREFLGTCGAGAMLACQALPLNAAATAPRLAFARVALVDGSGAPLRPAALEPGREYLFYYPFRSTPCFLLDLGEALAGGLALKTEDGQSYNWSGGVGPSRSIVAFSAICAHKLTYPSPVVSFIGYRGEPVGFVNRENEVERRAGVIQCCSEHSIYDPRRGAEVLAGPSPQPLAAIALSYEDDRLHVDGVYGGAVFERFFAAFSDRLRLEHRGDGFAEAVTGTATVLPAEQFTRNRIRCG